MALRRRNFLNTAASQGRSSARVALAVISLAAAAGIAMLASAAEPGPNAGFLATLRGSKHVTRTHMLEIAEFCQQEHADLLAQQFDEHIYQKGGTSCTDNSWLHTLQEISDPSQPRNFIDIGCNKGYVSASFFALWAPELGFSPTKILEWKPAVDCGSCGDCRDEVKPAKPAPPEAGDVKVNVVCVEPNLASFGELIEMREHFFPANSSRPSAQWSLLNAAISNSTARTVAFPRCPGGNENCGFEEHTDSQQFGVDVVAQYRLTDLLDMFGFAGVDVLKIDTEGYDAPAIIDGLPLLAGRVGVLAFEYHSKGAWAHHNLEDIVQLLDGAGFTCYFSGKKSPEGSLARMTGCWSAKYEVKGWSNIMCVRRDHALYPHAELASLRYNNPAYQQLYFKKTGTARKLRR